VDRAKSEPAPRVRLASALDQGSRSRLAAKPGVQERAVLWPVEGLNVIDIDGGFRPPAGAPPLRHRLSPIAPVEIGEVVCGCLETLFPDPFECFRLSCTSANTSLTDTGGETPSRLGYDPTGASWSWDRVTGL
jgi:hypothetical protein